MYACHNDVKALSLSCWGVREAKPPEKILDYGEENQDFLYEMLNM